MMEQRNHPDVIRVIGLRFSAAHGVFSEEETIRQDFEVDVEIKLDLSEAAQSDTLGDTVNYIRIAEEVSVVMEGPRRLLLEKLAGLIIERIAALVPAGEIVVRIRKPQARLNIPFQTVEVELRRTIAR